MVHIPGRCPVDVGIQRIVNSFPGRRCSGLENATLLAHIAAELSVEPVAHVVERGDM
jgi:hypothetical protein